ncbi:MAG: DegT/DnrJ/EryC1/StrS family aminotransferase [Bdellovibrio sp.]
MIRLSRSIVGTEEIVRVTKVLNEGYLGMGTQVKEFEENLQAYIGGVAKVACVNTGTSALHLACQAIGLQDGDEVLVPSLTFVATYQAISATGATPVSCDVNSEDALLDLVDAEKRITSRTKALVYVHYASGFGDLDKVYAFARKYNLRIIEDAAHSFGGSYKGKKIGSFGDITCFSFDGIKNITSGEGGAVVSRDVEVMQRVQDARLLGVEKDTVKRFSGQRSWDFDVTAQGWRYHMSNIMAAIGLAQLERFENEFAPVRRKYAQVYREKLSSCDQVHFLKHDEGTVPHIMPILARSRRDELREYLISHGVESGIHYKPNHMLSFYKKDQQALPRTEKLYGELLTLPLHPGLSESDILKITQLITEFYLK